MQYETSVDQTLLTYIQAIRSPEKLTEEETVHLIQRAKNGDTAARDRVCSANFDIVFYCVKHGNYTQNDSDTTDFLQEGIIGLLKAIDHFSPNKGAAFSTYARYWVTKYLWDYCRRNQFIIKPDKKFRLLAKMAQTERTYETTYGKRPDLETLGELLSLSPEETRKVKMEQTCFCMFAADAFPDSDDSDRDDFFNKIATGDSVLDYINCNVESMALEQMHSEELYQKLTACFGSGIDRDILDIILLSERETLSHAKIAKELSFSRTYISKRIQGMRANVKNILLELDPDLDPDIFHVA
ncbi:MAG: sigma-70 family RNA polymerase sigma factor [Clostridiales bacterium]|nr:sigma-70 family RNA polymerase sigma factor [Clostridiales bacterium]MCD8132478.1 sigma-70 family RNA polymerase sigma factor [Clostridiales bacterium]